MLTYPSSPLDLVVSKEMHSIWAGLRLLEGMLRENQVDEPYKPHPSARR